MNTESSNTKNRSPTEPQLPKKDKKTNKLLLRFLRYISKFFQDQKNPYLADKTCEIYLGEKNHIYQNKCRELLQTSVQLNPLQVDRFFETSLGNSLLKWFKRFFKIEHPDKQETLKKMMIEVAQNRYGVSLFSFLEQVYEDVDLDVEKIMLTLKDVQKLVKDTEIILKTIQELSQVEFTQQAETDFNQLPDLRKEGNFPVKKSHLTWMINNEYFQCTPVDVLLYQPHPLPEYPIPVIIQSHGLGSSPEILSHYAQHLASYGYFVIALKHLGSNAEYLEKMLSGKGLEVFELSEFIDRPLLVTSIIDELAKQNQVRWSGKLDTENIGFMGTSFGAYTGFMLAGAKIDFERLEMACDPLTENPNMSILLQCEALKLPRQPYQLQDDRIKAILCLDSFGSEIFGEKGIKPISIPTMLIAGSHDFVAPLIFEQIRLFQWLTTAQHYLVLMEGKSHMPDFDLFTQGINLQFKISGVPTIKITKKNIFENYIQAFSIAFFDLYIKKMASAQTYLTSNYAHYLHQNANNMWLISRTSRELLTSKLA
jgi:predicted dienelactone hydrolase